MEEEEVGKEKRAPHPLQLLCASRCLPLATSSWLWSTGASTYPTSEEQQWMDGERDGWKDGWIEGWTDGWKDEGMDDR